jgi:hypothetical protein
MNWLPLISCVNLSRWANLLRRDFSLVSCLRTSLDSSASDPRDKVFAITGLLDPYIRAMIVIDYMLPVEEVFRQAVSVCIVERGDLELLEYAELPEIDGLTSTLTAPTFSMLHLQRFLANTTKKANPVVRPTFVRSYGYVPAGQLLPRLEVRACFLDTCTGYFFPTDNGDMATVKASDPESLWRFGSSQAVWTIFEKGPGAFAIEKNWRELSMNISDLQHRSSSGNWINFNTRYSFGSTSGHCQPKDIVTIIDGLSRPCLLRKVSEDCYRIVGTC